MGGFPGVPGGRFGPGGNDRQLQEMQKQIEEMRRLIEELRREIRRGPDAAPRDEPRPKGNNPLGPRAPGGLPSGPTGGDTRPGTSPGFEQ
jgi:hypothetical protein